MARFRKKPTVIDAAQFLPGKNDDDMLKILDGVTGWHMDGGNGIALPTANGLVSCVPGAWVCRQEVNGKPDVWPVSAEVRRDVRASRVVAVSPDQRTLMAKISAGKKRLQNANRRSRGHKTVTRAFMLLGAAEKSILDGTATVPDLLYAIQTAKGYLKSINANRAFQDPSQGGKAK